MPARCLRPVLVLAAALACVPAWAAKVAKVEIVGLKDEAMLANVRSALSLQAELDKELRPRRLAWLLRSAEDEARQALEPFGYYAPTITVSRSDRQGDNTAAAPSADADADAGDDAQTANDDTAGTEAKPRRKRPPLTITVHIDPGPPVRVRQFALGIAGPAEDDATVADALAAFQPRPGAVFDHARYETGKAQVAQALARHGYFDAALDRHRVEVTRAQHRADIDLHWQSGPRYALGAAGFQQQPTAIITPALLQKLLPWTPGDAYDEAKLDRLRSSLVALDYFALIDAQADPAQAQDGQVPVTVNLTPAKRSIYSIGASYGTLSGVGLNAGIERRYLNARGHKMLTQFDWASQRKAATAQYRIPAFAWRDGWYAASLQAVDEQTKYVNSRRLELVASRSGQYNPFLNLTAALHLLRERWAVNVADDGDGAIAPPRFQIANFTFPALRAEYIDVDQRMTPRRGAGGTLTLRGGKGGADGRASFLQLHASAQWFHGFDGERRLIARGEFGHTFTKDVLNLPPSLRYYAGGDRSVRGYGWHEIGPKLEVDGGDYYTGAPNVITASLEYEHYFHGPWGAAVFVDTGDAFDGRRASLHTGVGIGLRWRSPVGPVRIDIARGLDQPDSPLTLHLNIGADL